MLQYGHLRQSPESALNYSTAHSLGSSRRFLLLSLSCLSLVGGQRQGKRNVTHAKIMELCEFRVSECLGFTL